MFTNAGMVQFKNVFTGLENARPRVRHVAEMRARRRQAQRSRQCRLHRAPSHLLRDARQLLLRRLFQGAGDRAGLEPGHEGIRPRSRQAAGHGLCRDDEAFDLWRKIAGLPDEKIIRIATSDNFWAMGDTGPCGPCSEIFYDHGDHISPAARRAAPDEDGDRFIEIWNLVFMQYRAGHADKRVNLPKPSIDTGMGLERLQPCCRASTTITTPTCSVLDRASEDLTGVGGRRKQASHRVIADHLRSTSFLIADGVTAVQ
jgi:alanyl-tRNA synthetase